jgi:hypothetical protein
VGRVKEVLWASHRAAFDSIRVIGVAIGQDLEGGAEYLSSFGPLGTTFDELSIGGGWLNSFVVDLMWRGGYASPAVPEILVVQRKIDATAYPSHIGVEDDSLLLAVEGRDSVLAWISRGAPLTWAR